MGTPVLDRAPFSGSEPGDQRTIYFVTRIHASGTCLQESHAVNIRDGAQRPGSPVVISASVPGSDA